MGHSVSKVTTVLCFSLAILSKVYQENVNSEHTSATNKSCKHQQLTPNLYYQQHSRRVTTQQRATLHYITSQFSTVVIHSISVQCNILYAKQLLKPSSRSFVVEENLSDICKSLDVNFSLSKEFELICNEWTHI